MKFNEYLKEQKHSLDDAQKLLIYDEIKTEIDKQSIFSRVSFYVKVSVYTFILVFLFSGLFFNLHNEKVSKNILVDKKVNTVYADYIGKVIKSKWSFEIYDDNKLLNTDKISKWNILVLKDNSYVRLQVNEGIKVYLLWPAKIQINFEKKNGKKNYIFNMLDGDYITLKSNSEQDKIVLKSKFFNVESNDKNIDIKYEDKDGVAIIANNGGEVIVKNKNNIIKLSNKEKLIVLNEKDKKYIENLLSDDYKKYQINWNGDLKIILPSTSLEKIGNILNKRNVMLATWKYVLWKLNKNIELKEAWEKQLRKIVVNVYNILWLEADPSLSLKSLIENLISNIEKKYILPKVYIQRLKVVLSYLVITDMKKIPEWVKFNDLSSLIDYIKLDNKYKKILKNF